MRNVRILIAVIAAFLLVVPVALAQVKPPVPNVAGMPLNTAQKALVSVGFNAVVTQENVADPNKNNVVLRQQVSPGTTLAKGSSVPVVVGRYTAPAQQPVPNVVGMKLGEAQSALAKAKLNAAVTMQPVDQPQRNDVVLTQQVAPGKTLPPGSMVPVVVGKYAAPARVNVPYVTGKPLAEAQKILVANKLNAEVTMQPVTEPQRNGIVLGQKVAAGTPVAPGSMVPVVVGKYTAPTTMPVPNVTGKPLAEAQKALAANKLNAVVSMEAVTEPAKNNVVLRQQSAPGTALAPGSQVPLVVGKFSAPTTAPVPNVTGMKIDQAKPMLEKQGWKVQSIRRILREAGQNNIVLQQTPAAGAQSVPQQTTVTLTVGSYTGPTPGAGGQTVPPHDNRPQSYHRPLNPPAEPDAIVVPDTVGKNLADARNAIRMNGLSPDRIIIHEKIVADPKLAAGVIRSQKPNGGSAVPYKTPPPIELWVDIYKKHP